MNSNHQARINVEARRQPGGWDVIRAVTGLPGAAPADVWHSVTTAAGINAELYPLLKMTRPRGMDAETLDGVTLNRPLGRAWVLLGGVLPVDYDDVEIVERTPGHRFLERSKTSATKVWRHERVVEETPDGARIIDEVHYQVRPHVRPARAVFGKVVTGIFRHRHQRLQRHFAAAPSSTTAA